VAAQVGGDQVLTRGLIPKWSRTKRVTYTAEYKLGSCRKPRPPLPHEAVSPPPPPGKVVTLRCWRTCGAERANGILEALTPQRRGPKSQRHPMDEENQKLRRQNARLTEDLRKAYIIIDVQKKWLRCWVIRFRSRNPEEKVLMAAVTNWLAM